MAKIPVTKPGPVIVGPPLTNIQPITLPPWIAPTPTPPGSGTPQALTVSERTFTSAKVGDDIPLVYGRDVVGAKIYRAKTSGNQLIVICVWCEGEISQVEKVVIDGATFTGTATHYTGTAGQTADAFVAAVWGQSDVLANVAYSVLRLPAETGLGIASVLSGRLIYDPRTTSTGYSTNPALILADFIDTQSEWTVNWASVGDAADYCDEIITGAIKRWEIGLTVKRSKVTTWIDTLRRYANLFLYNQDGELFFLPDEPRTVDHTLTGADIKNLQLRKLGQRDIPTQVFTDYTLPGANEWQDAEVFTPDPLASEPLRITRLRMPGFFRAMHAKRKAEEALNRAELEDLEATFELFDDGLKVVRGDVVAITHPLGLTSKQFRVHDIDILSRGRWRLICREYAAGVYSDATDSDPTLVDTELPNPNDVPFPLNLVLSVGAPQYETGIYLSSIGATWDALVDYPYDHSYEVVLKQGGAVVDSRIVTGLEINVGPLLEGLTYDIELTGIGVFGAKSTVVTDSIDVDGKNFPPTDVPDFSVIGIGAELRATWGASADNISIWRYELRYGSSGVTWDGATLILKVDALKYSTRDIPPGTWDILIKAIDNTFNESVNAAVVTGVLIDADSDAFVLSSKDADHASNTGMTLINSGTQWVVDSGETWNALFPLAMNTYTDPLYSYQTAGVAIWTSEELDPGIAALGGTWRAQAAVNNILGTAVEQLEIFDGSTWVDQNAISIKTEGTKSRYEASGDGDIFIITPTVLLTVNVEATTIRGFSTTLASDGDRITFEPPFSSMVSIVSTIAGTSNAASLSYDIENAGPVNWVEFYAFDNANAQIIRDYSYVIRGVIGTAPVFDPTGILLDNLVSWWDLDASSGVRVDSHGTNDMDERNNPTSGTGHRSVAVVCSTSNYLINLGATSALGGPGDYTVTAWVFPTSHPGFATILSPGAGQQSNTPYMVMLSSGKPKFYVSDGSDWKILTHGTTAPLNQWSLITAKHDGTTKTMSITINQETPVTLVYTGTALTLASSDLRLGSYHAGDGFEFVGRLDVANYYDAITTVEQDAELWNDGQGTDYANVSATEALPLPAGATFILDATDATSLFTDIAKTTQAGDGDRIAVWADLSGNGNDWTQSTGANQAILDTVNGRVHFDSSTSGDTPDVYMLGPDISGWTEGTFSARVQLVSLNGGGVWGTTTANTSATLNHWNGYITFGNDSRQGRTSPGDAVDMNYEENVSVGGGQLSYKDGVLHSTDTAGTIGFRSAPTLGCGIRSGVPQYSGEFYFYRMVGYDRILTPTERTQVNDWLNA